MRKTAIRTLTRILDVVSNQAEEIAYHEKHYGEKKWYDALVKFRRALNEAKRELLDDLEIT